MTEAEALLWSKIRNRQLEGWKFRRQHIIDRYIADFVCVEVNLIVEVDGGQHTEAGDMHRTQFLESGGWRVMRFWNNEVLENTEGVCEAIIVALEKGYPPSP